MNNTNDLFDIVDLHPFGQSVARMIVRNPSLEPIHRIGVDIAEHDALYIINKLKEILAKKYMTYDEIDLRTAVAMTKDFRKDRLFIGENIQEEDGVTSGVGKLVSYKEVDPKLSELHKYRFFERYSDIPREVEDAFSLSIDEVNNNEGS